jgi:hypothetical protein
VDRNRIAVVTRADHPAIDAGDRQHRSGTGMFIVDDAFYYARRAAEEAAQAEAATTEKSRFLHTTLAAEYRRRANLAPGQAAQERINRKITILIE